MVGRRGRQQPSQWPYGEVVDPDEQDEGEVKEGEEEESETDYEQELAAAQSKVKAANAEAKKYRLRLKEANRQLVGTQDKDERSTEAIRERNELRVENAVLKAAMQHGVDPDLLELKLRKTGHLKLDEDGDLDEDFDEAAATVAKQLVGGPRPNAPKSPTLSRGNKGGKESDLAALARNYPALTRKMGG